MSELATIRGTAVHRLQSSHLHETLRVEVGLPIGYETSGADYPVVYLIDGSWYFAQVFEAATAMTLAGEICPSIVVGVGYEPQTDDRSAEFQRVSQLRCRDLTPTHDPSEWWRIAGAGEPVVTDFETGHAATFMKALDEIRALIAGQYRIHLTESILAGFSLGALFALEVLFTRPGSFQSYLCGSPSLWWHDGVMFERARAYDAQAGDLETNLFLSVGALEGTGTASGARMVENVRSFADQLTRQRHPRLRLHYRVFEEDTHATSAGPAFAHGMKALLAGGTTES